MFRTFLAAACLGLALLIGIDLARQASAHRAAIAARSARPRRVIEASHSPLPPPAAAPASPVPQLAPIPFPGVSETPALDMISRLAIRRRLAREGDRVYLDSLLAHTDSVLTRWPDRAELRVALIPDTTLAGWSPALLDEARAAMTAWADNQSGLTFREVAPTDSADITVHWVRALRDTSEDGLTTLAWNNVGVVHSADVALALYASDSIVVPAAVRARVAVHELGHALGLPHSDRDDDVMFHTSPVELPSQRDEATLRLLYAVAPGPLKVQQQP